MSSKLKLQRQRDRQRRRHRDILERVQNNFPHQKIVTRPTPDGIKISDVLREFVEPYMDLAQTEEAYRKLLMTAVIAWNVTLFPEQERMAKFEKFLQCYPAEVMNEARNIIEELMVRKEKYFSQYRRMILDFEVTDTGRGWHLSVVSTEFDK